MTAVSLTLPYQGREFVIDDVSQVMRSSWQGRREICEVAKTLGCNLENDLGSRVDLINNTLLHHLPEAKDQTKNILIALLKTALIVSLIAGAVWGGIFLAPALGVALGIVAASLSLFFFATASEEYVFPERRVQKGEPPGPWFCPNIETLRGRIAATSIVWPVLGGLIVPLIEACTRKSRWEQVLSKQNEQLAECIPSLCAFYKTHGQELVDNLQEKKSSSPSWDKKRWEEALESVGAQVAFLKNFDPDVPVLNIHAEKVS
jgi:hypothetical protein